MSAAVQAMSATKDVGFSSQVQEVELKTNRNINKDAGAIATLHHHDENVEVKDEVDADEEDELATLKSDKELVLGPKFSLKEQLDKDKDDESLRKWKAQLLGSVDLSAVGESKEAEVRILSLTMMFRDRPELVLPIPFTNKPKSSLFTLKGGSKYRTKFTFSVSKNIVSGLMYTTSVWKTGVKVHSSKKMIGTFSPQQDPYTYETEEDTTPSGMFARGWYFVRTKFLDDDGKCYLDTSYYFEIQKNWATPS
ncbi:rho GDP-dissociation inhibitor 1-like [Argentina anserina]|uniref:rho GDP-dissociation inhibitor 1-like n=1 Tax=Argentina anserina TaxID=57926 RepID=UPI0021762716|nr:rho GDP-dissociation inhibitor 1-like [Potentilla anserina]